MDLTALGRYNNDIERARAAYYATPQAEQGENIGLPAGRPTTTGVPAPRVCGRCRRDETKRSRRERMT